MSPGSCRLAQARAADLLLPVHPACPPACLLLQAPACLEPHCSSMTPHQGLVCIESELPECCWGCAGRRRSRGCSMGRAAMRKVTATGPLATVPAAAMRKMTATAPAAVTRRMTPAPASLASSTSEAAHSLGESAHGVRGQRQNPCTRPWHPVLGDRERTCVLTTAAPRPICSQGTCREAHYVPAGLHCAHWSTCCCQRGTRLPLAPWLTAWLHYGRPSSRKGRPM